MRKVTSTGDLVWFRHKYRICTGHDVSLRCLTQGEVYVFHHRGRIRGGFVLINAHDSQSLDGLVYPPNYLSVLRKLGDLVDYCDICCVWIDRSCRKKLRFAVKIWLSLAMKVARRKEGNALFGTSIRELATLYAMHGSSKLVHRDYVRGSETYLFTARRRDFPYVILAILMHRLASAIGLEKLGVKFGDRLIST